MRTVEADVRGGLAALRAGTAEGWRVLRGTGPTPRGARPRGAALPTSHSGPSTTVIESFAGIGVGDLSMALGTTRWGVVVDGVPVAIYPTGTGALRLKRLSGTTWVDTLTPAVSTRAPFSAPVYTPTLAVQPGSRRVVAVWSSQAAIVLADWPDLLLSPDIVTVAELSRRGPDVLTDPSFPSVDIAANGTAVVAFQARIDASYVPYDGNPLDPTYQRIHYVTWNDTLPTNDDVVRIEEVADTDTTVGMDTPTAAISDDPAAPGSALVVIAWRYIPTPYPWEVKDVHCIAGSVTVEAGGARVIHVDDLGLGRDLPRGILGSAPSAGSGPHLPTGVLSTLPFLWVTDLPALNEFDGEEEVVPSWPSLGDQIAAGAYQVVNVNPGTARDADVWCDQEGNFWMGFTNYTDEGDKDVSIDIASATVASSGVFSTPVSVSDGVAEVDTGGRERFAVNNFVNGFAATDTTVPCVAAWENGPVLRPSVEQSRTIELNFCTGDDAWGDAATWPNPLGLGWSVHRMGQYPSTFMVGNTLYLFWMGGQGSPASTETWVEAPTLYLSSWSLA